MKNCRNCRKKNCEYKDKAFKNMTIYCSEHCVAEIKRECDEIATEEFRKVINALRNGNYQIGSVKGILNASVRFYDL